MVSAIHPLGERARHNRWLTTVSFFTIGAAAGGAVIGATLGLLGSALFGEQGSLTLALTGAVAAAAGLLDLAWLGAPGPSRQVNENWIGHFRGWVYGGGFGVQLGVGVATYVVTWTVYAMLAAALLSASPLLGAMIGTTFGLGRSIAPLVAGWIDRPSRLSLFHRRMADIGPTTRRLASIFALSLSVIAVAGLLP